MTPLPSAAPATARARVAFLAALLIIGIAFGSFAVLVGHHLMNAKLIWPPSLLFGFDVARNIDVMTHPSIDRSNVHPLIGVMTRPFTYLVRLADLTAGMSAVIVTSAAGVLGLWLTAYYLRLRAVSRIDTLIVVFLLASSLTWLASSTLPGTYIFSFAILALTHIWLVKTVRCPAELLSPRANFYRQLAWVGLGVFNYGTTVTMGAFWFLTYGFSLAGGARRWLRAVGMGCVVFLAGIFLSMAVGSWINLQAERQFILGGVSVGTPPPHPILRSASTALVWGFVAPNAQLVDLEGSEAWTIVTFLNWDYTPAGAALAGAWGLLLAAALWHAARQRAALDRRLNLALAACLLFHILLHGFYMVANEGTFAFTAHSLFPVIGLLAPLSAQVGSWRTPPRVAFRAALLLLALILTLRHADFLWFLPDFVPIPADYLANL